MLEDKIIGKIEDGKYVITATDEEITCGKEMSKGVPAFMFGEYDGIYSDGDGSFIACYNNTSADDLKKYSLVLENNGYRKFAESDMLGNLFYTYENGINLVYAYYIKFLNTVKVIAEPYYEYITDLKEENLVKPAIIASSACDRNFYVRLPNNTLVIVDGGWRIEDWSLYDHYDLFKKMYEEMREILGGKEIIEVPLWIITHAHTDHAKVLELLYKTDLIDKFSIKQIICNFPARNHIVTPMEATEEQYAEMKKNLEEFHRDAGVKFPYDRLFHNCPFQVYDTQRYDNIIRKAIKNYNATIIKAHDGMSFTLSGVKFEILHTPDDDMPAIYTGFNNTSIVVKMTYKGSSMLWTGDMEAVPSDSCVKMYGDLLKCDALQVAHHGWGAATPEFYEKASPSVLFWNNSEFGFKYADRFQGYGKTKNSTDLYNMKCVKKNFFCNRIRMSYAYLPVTFESEKPAFDDCVIAASSVSDRIYMLRLPDNKIIVFDGGWRKEDWALYGEKTLTGKFFNELKALAKSENVVISAFIVSDIYEHNNRFLEALNASSFKDSIKIEKIIYNFVSPQKIECGYSELSDPDYYGKIISAYKATGAELITAKTGSTFDLSGVSVKILYSPDEEKFVSVADTSLVTLIEYKGQKLLITGDMTDRISEKLLKEYGDALKCDAVQVANHGWKNCGTLEFYKTVNARLQLWNNSEYGFQFFRKDDGYKKQEIPTKIYNLPGVKLNVFCDEVSTQYYSFPLKDKELKYDV